MSKIAIGSLAPWSPGHVVQETEFLIQKQLLNNCRDSVQYILFPGSVSSFYSAVYSEWLERFNIHVVSNGEEIGSILASQHLIDEFVTVSLSHNVHLPTGEYDKSLFRRSENQSIITELSGGRLSSFAASSSFVSFSANQFARSYYALPLNHTALPKVVDCGLESVLPDVVNSEIVLVNIRVHSANASSSASLNDWIPLLKFLVGLGYTVIDVSHDQKPFNDVLQSLGVIPYWGVQTKSFLTDLELFSRAKFYVGGGGISHLALALRIPTIWIGQLFPGPIAGADTLLLPCRLRSRLSGVALSQEEAFGIFLDLPDPWSVIYDCFSNVAGSGNPYNCYEYLRSMYFVDNPSSVNILRTFQFLHSELSSNSSRNPVQFCKYSHVDIEGHAYVTAKVSPYF